MKWQRIMIENDRVNAIKLKPFFFRLLSEDLEIKKGRLDRSQFKELKLKCVI
jgi:hypothetical protein